MSLPARSPRADDPSHRNLLLLSTGSVATIKLPLLVAQLLTHPLNITVLLTPTALRFLAPAELALLRSLVRIHVNEDEWTPPWTRGAPVLHIELRKWADLMLVAPLSANSLGSMAAGLCQGLGMSVVRAWDTEGFVGDREAGGGARERVPDGQEGTRRKRKMILVAPAMNTQMWKHPVTEEHLGKLRTWGWVRVLPPVEKLLACGDLGLGGMMEVGDIVGEVVRELELDGNEGTRA